MLFLLLACKTAETDSPKTTCDLSSPSVDRLDVPTGYRVFDAPVQADWLPEARVVPVNLWYATDATSGDFPTYEGLFPDPQSLIDAPFADPGADCLLPLVVYSHGSQAWGGNSSPLLRHLVAQGWVAAAPDHLTNTLVDNVDPHPASFSLTRAADIRATIDAIENLSEDDPLFGRVDTSKVLVTGHSYGAQTAWILSGPTFDTATIAARCDAEGCSDAERAAFAQPVDDPRIVAVMPMDGFAGSDLVASSGWAGVERPILYLNRSGDGDSDPFDSSAPAAVTWARFEGACHETFTMTPLSCDGFEKEEGLDVVAAYETAFAATTILGSQDAVYTGILDGSTVVDTRVSVSVRE